MSSGTPRATQACHTEAVLKGFVGERAFLRNDPPGRGVG